MHPALEAQQHLAVLRSARVLQTACARGGIRQFLQRLTSNEPQVWHLVRKTRQAVVFPGGIGPPLQR